MKSKKQNPFLLAAITLAGFAFTASSAFATEYYWDSDASNPGFGNTTGTWGTDAFWSTDATGASATANTTITDSDTVNFGTDTLNYDNAAVGVVSGGVSVNKITFGAGQTTAVTIGTTGNNITLGGASPTITVNAPTEVMSIVNSLIEGTSGYTKEGPGKLFLNSGAATTYTNLIGGVVTVKNGILDQQARLDFVNSIVIGGSGSSGASFLTGRIMLPAITVDPPDSGSIIIGSNTTAAAPQIRSTISLNSVDLTIQTFSGTGTGTLGFNNGTGISGTGNLTLKHQADGGNISFSAPYDLNMTGNLLVEGNSSGNTNILSIVGSNVGSVTKSGTATMLLRGANSYTGDTAVNQGTLSITNDTALGTTDGDTTVESTVSGNVTLNLKDATSDLTVAENITFNSNDKGRARLENTAAFNHTLSGDITVNTTTTNIPTEFNSANNSGSITLSGDITGNLSNAGFLLRGTSTSVNNQVSGNVTLTGDNPFVKTDAGTWTLGASGKTFSAAGGLQVTNGILKMGAASVLSATTVVTMGNAVNSTGTLDLNGFDQTVAGITQLTGTTGTKKITSSSGPAVLTVNNADDYSPDFTIFTGSLGLTKTGVGILTLSGANTHTGDTVVSEGTLELVDGAQLKFVLGDSDVNNSLTGAGTVTLDGDFVIDTTAADALSSGSWTLENVSTLTGPYGSNFSVVDFNDIGDDKWEKELSPTQKYTFDEDTGILTLATTGGGFASWITQPFANGTVTNQGPNDDDDNDGIRNLVEYAIAGEDPTVPNATIGTLTGTSLSFAKRLDATGLTYAIQQSIDLGIGDDWTEVTGGTYVNDTDEISYGFTPGTPAKNFFRLQVESN